MYNNTQLQGFTNNILNMDCLDFMHECPDNYFDLVLTDPPYGIGLGTKTVIYDGKKHGKAKTERKTYHMTNWDNEIPSEEYFNEIKRISKNQIIFGGNYFIEYLTNSSCWLVWDKNNGNNDFADCELAWTSFNSAVRKYKWTWNGMLQENMKNKEMREHPTQKPVGLFQNILSDYSKEGEIILDCFSGSGTTAIACHNLKRNFICIEKDVDYYNASVERLNNAKAQLKLF